ncbi:MAG: enoyl-CoA hydratase/isomerase family protein [Chloroflexi bacterium]|nr:enoyl-CoA hydratase/isomerase family protein [Chloroflexota bacterium]
MHNVHDKILFSVCDSVATITLNRPDILNAIDLEMAEQLKQRLRAAEQAADIRALVVTSAGQAFCAGGDLRFAMAANPDTPGNSFLALTEILHACIAQIRTMPKPVIAAINGAAAGAGSFLALACDLRIMADDTYLKQSNTSHGLSIPAGGTFTLPRLVGLARALEIAMLDEPIFAMRALELGLVTRVVPATQMGAETQQLASRVARMPMDILGRVKHLMNTSWDSSLEEHLERERGQIAASANSAEGREGVHAFLEKRQPDFINAALALTQTSDTSI